MPLYLYECKSDWSGPIEKVVEEAYYGPFNDMDDAKTHMNDAYADRLEALGAEIMVVEMADDMASKFYINPREFWMSQLATITDIQETLNA